MNWVFKYCKQNVTKLGLLVCGFVLVTVTVFALQYFMERLLVREAHVIGMRSAENVEHSVADMGKIFTGDIDKQTEVRIFERLSAAAQIYAYEFINPKAEVVFKTGSYHPAKDTEPAQYHGHEHDHANAAEHSSGSERDHKKLSAAELLAKSIAINKGTYYSVSEGHVSHISKHNSQRRHSIVLNTGDGVRQPHHYATVNHPIFRNGNFLGRIRVSIDQTDLHFLFNDTFLWLTLTLLGVSALGFGVPTLFYIRKKSEMDIAAKQVQFLAQHDEMTQLVNRKKFVETVDELLQTSHGPEVSYAMHIIDVDKLKTINDTYGHDAGDKLLQQISDHLTHSFASHHVISRLGGDEFAVLQTNATGEQSVEEFANQLLMIFSGSYQTSNVTVETSASIGVALSGDESTSCLSLMMRAEIAQRLVKSSGGARFLVFEPDMKQRLDEKLELEETIRHALRDDLFEIYYQPLFSGADIKLCGFEALLRMKGQDGNFISPAEFIPVAEEISLIDEIGSWVLKTATKSASNWPHPLFLAVNLSTRQFESGELVEGVESALKESGLPANRLELEITEGLIMHNTDWNLVQLHALKSLGVSIAMDDFGTGYSSMSYLWRFPFDKIKIDQSFLREAENKNKNVTKIIQTIIMMGHSLNMEVTTEGIETTEQLKMLRRFNCDCLQGFLLGRPMPEKDIAALLMKDFVGKVIPAKKLATKSKKVFV